VHIPREGIELLQQEAETKGRGTVTLRFNCWREKEIVRREDKCVGVQYKKNATREGRKKTQTSGSEGGEAPSEGTWRCTD